MNLTEHFTREEMERSSTGIRKGLDNTCPPSLLPYMLHVAEQLELIRSHFGTPIHVTSCYRSPSVNRAVGGSKASAHTLAYAADCEVQGVAVLDVCRWCSENIKEFDQIIYEFGPDGWMHIGFTHKKPRGQLLTARKESGKTVYSLGLAG